MEGSKTQKIRFIKVIERFFRLDRILVKDLKGNGCLVKLVEEEN